MAIYGTIAARQHGLVLRAQLVERGLTERQIDLLLQRGDLIRVNPSVYRVAGAPVSPKQRILASCFAAGPWAAAARRTAAYLHRMIDRFPPRIEVIVPMRKQPKPDGFFVLRSGIPFEVIVADGVPVTEPVRTLLDLASVVPLVELGVVLDRAIRMRTVRLDALETALVAFRGKGVANLRSLVAERVGATLAEGELESRFLHLLDQLDIPQPVRQHKIFENGVEVARLDLAYVEEKVAIEIDAYSDHSDMRAFVRDRRRNSLIAANHGYVFLHFTRPDLTQPRYIRDVVMKTLARRRDVVPPTSDVGGTTKVVKRGRNRPRRRASRR